MDLDGYMIPAFLLSMVGTGLFIYGRKAPSIVAGVAGVLLIAETCVLFTPWVLWTVGLFTLAGFVVAKKALEG